MKELIKKFIPQFLLQAYHYSLAVLAKWLYGHPSQHMLVIGVTGTAGKSSTCYFIAQILERAGYKVGMTTTTLFKIRDKEWLNDKKMTMLGRLQTQQILKRMQQAGCQIAIIETSSQGIEQYRHIGINYDWLVFTNLYPEHIEAHGSFENYQRAKGKLFKRLSRLPRKSLQPFGRIKKTIMVNIDDEHANYFLSFPADKKITYGLNQPANISWQNYEFNLLGTYNKYNALAGVAVAKELKVDEQKIKTAVTHLKPLPGRLEFIPNNLGIQIIVDYSFEPKAVSKLYQTVKEIEHKRIIHVLGSTGGGRDKARRPLLGQLAAQQANIIIVTNEDPYDEDPKAIIAQVVEGAMGDNFSRLSRGSSTKSGQFPISNFQTILKFKNSTGNKEIYAILDRRQAIRKALELTQPGDLVLITGKGAEQAMCVANNKMIPWDDRQVVKEEAEKLA